MPEAVIVSAVRTATGTFGGSLKDISAPSLGAAVIAEALVRAGLEPADVDEVIMGNVLQAGLGQNPARQASVYAGIPYEIPATTINKLCGSGLKSVALAAMAIRSGAADCIVAGGMENMSAAPYVLPALRWGARMGQNTADDVMIRDGLWDVFNDYHMGITAENLAQKFSLSRGELDAFAAGSQQKAEQAIRDGAFDEEIVPLNVREKKKERLFSVDESPRLGTTLEILAGLRPAFKKDGVVTAGNSSGINDGAAAVIVMSEPLARAKGLPILARIVAYASAGVDPSIMGYGPVPASRKALQLAGWDMDALDFIEANEAFAAQALTVSRELALPAEKLNINGGAIALGHPIGASGARILVTLLHILKHHQGHKGLATLCIGGGQGIAMLVERV